MKYLHFFWKKLCPFKKNPTLIVTRNAKETIVKLAKVLNWLKQNCNIFSYYMINGFQ